MRSANAVRCFLPVVYGLVAEHLDSSFFGITLIGPQIAEGLTSRTNPGGWAGDRETGKLLQHFPNYLTVVESADFSARSEVVGWCVNRPSLNGLPASGPGTVRLILSRLSLK